MAELAKLVDDLSALTVIEAAELAKMLEEKWGVSAAAPVAAAAAAAPAAEAVAEKTEFDVILATIGEKKVNVIKEVRALTQLARADKDVEALTVSGDTIYAAGQFTSIGLQHRGGLAAFDANGALTDWQPTAGSVNALA